MASGTTPKYADGTDTGWQTYTNTDVFTGTLYYRKIGSMVEIAIAPWFQLVNAVAVHSYVTLAPAGTLPVGYRPSKDVMGSCFVNSTVVPNRAIPARITTAGAVTIYAPGAEANIPTNSNMTLSAFYFV